MSIDDRLREGLARNGYADAVPTEPALDRVLRLRRRGRVRRATVLVAAVAAVAAMVPWATSLWPSDPRTAQPTTNELVGTYRVDVPATAGARLAGRWLLTLAADGRLVVDSPPQLPERADATYGLNGGVLVTDLLADIDCRLPGTTEVGRYRVEQRGSTLSFTIVSDGCLLRQDLFAVTWKRVPS